MKKLVVLISVAILIVAGVQASTWSDVQVDPFTDKIIGSAFCTNSEGDFIVVRNTEGYKEIFFGNMSEYISSDDVGEFMYRFDKGEVYTEEGALSTSGDSIFIFNDVIDYWLDEIAGRDWLAIRIMTYTGESFNMMLDISLMYKELLAIGL